MKQGRTSMKQGRARPSFGPSRPRFMKASLSLMGTRP